MSRTFITSGNRNSYRVAPGYQHRSTLGGAFETTRTVWHVIGKPALALFACGIVATFALVALGA